MRAGEAHRCRESAALRQQAISAGRRSIMPFQTIRVAS
jgi:hypothetical protein